MTVLLFKSSKENNFKNWTSRNSRPSSTTWSASPTATTSCPPFPRASLSAAPNTRPWPSFPSSGASRWPKTSMRLLMIVRCALGRGERPWSRPISWIWDSRTCIRSRRRIFMCGATRRIFSGRPFSRIRSSSSERALRLILYFIIGLKYKKKIFSSRSSNY